MSSECRYSIITRCGLVSVGGGGPFWSAQYRYWHRAVEIPESNFALAVIEKIKIKYSSLAWTVFLISIHFVQNRIHPKICLFLNLHEKNLI